jgi:hypothetical protein
LELKIHRCARLTRMIGIADFPKISHVKKRAFLAAFSSYGSLSKSAKRAKVDRRTHYNWLKDDPWYVRAFQQAVVEAGDSLQDKLTEMAFEGNVTAAIFLLKGLKPETYRDRVENTNVLELDLTKLSPEQLNALAQKLLAEHRADHGLPADPTATVESTRAELEAKVIEGTAARIEPGTIVIETESMQVESRST